MPLRATDLDSMGPLPLLLDVHAQQAAARRVEQRHRPVTSTRSRPLNLFHKIKEAKNWGGSSGSGLSIHTLFTFGSATDDPRSTSTPAPPLDRRGRPSLRPSGRPRRRSHLRGSGLWSRTRRAPPQPHPRSSPAVAAVAADTQEPGSARRALHPLAGSSTQSPSQQFVAANAQPIQSTL